MAARLEENFFYSTVIILMLNAVKLLEGLEEKIIYVQHQNSVEREKKVEFQVSSLQYLLPTFKKSSNAEDHWFFGVYMFKHHGNNWSGGICA